MTDTSNIINNVEQQELQSVSELIESISQLEIECTKEHRGDLKEIIRLIESPFPFDFGEILLKQQIHQTQLSRCDRSIICVICNIIKMQNKTSLVKCHMGSMAQCRGVRGDELRDAGAISAILSILWNFMVPLHASSQWIPRCTLTNNTDSTFDFWVSSSPLPPTAGTSCRTNANVKPECIEHHHLRKSYSANVFLNALHSSAIDLAIVCLGALRDLSCGSAMSRSAILDWKPPFNLDFKYRCNGKKCLYIKNGIHLLCGYMVRYHDLSWEEVMSLKYITSGPVSDVPTMLSSITDRGKRELRLLTNALGAIRNTSHSTPDNCQEFFECGLTDILIWRINRESINEFDNGRYWREAMYRTAGSLINLAEKCPSVAYQLGSDRKMILLLIETWGGANAVSSDPRKLKSIPLLHLGLAAILHAAKEGALEGGLDDTMARILEREMTRKKIAQKKEEERRQRLIQQS